MPAMCPDPHIPTDPEIMKRLLVEMRQYRGKYGIYAAEMLETARLLLEQSVWHPRQAEAAAYCIRQAVGEIFGDTRDYTEPLSDMVERVAKAKDSVQTADAADEGALRRLYGTVDELKERVCSPNLEARLKDIFREASWIEPEDGPHPLILDYRRIKKNSNKLAHRVSETPTDAGKVRDHHEEAVDILALIFLPTERLARIEQLAELPAPQKSDLDELRRIMKNAYGFDHFASKMSSPDWFDMMEPDMLKSPSGNPQWLLRSLARHLKDEHVDAFVEMLDKHFNRWASDEAGLDELGFAAYKSGDSGIPCLIKILERSKSIRKEYDRKINERSKMNQSDPKFYKETDRIGSLIRNIDYHVQRAFLNIKQPNSEFIELAEHLLNSDSTVDAHYKTIDIPAKLVECMNRKSAIRIVEILVRELQAKPESGQLPWIPRLNLADEPDYGIYGLVASLHDALVKAMDLGVPTPRLIETLDKLSDVARPRFEAWLYSRADDVAASDRVRYVADACGSRPPTDEDGLLLDRLKRDGHIQDMSEQITNLLGKAPDTKQMVGQPSQWSISREERWHTLWAHTMRPYVELPDEWKPCLDIVDRFDETKRDYISWQALGAPEVQDDTDLLDRYGTDVPLEVATKIAAEEPDTGGFLNPPGSRSPVSDLETAVRNNVSGWVEDPAAIIRALRRPEYVASYLRGLGGAKDALTSHADKIIFAVKFAKSLQWDGDASSSTTVHHDDRLMSVDMVGIGLIKEVIKSDIGLSKDSLEDVWSVVTDAIICPDPETGERPNYSIEYLHTVDGLPHVQAASTLFEVIRYAKLNNAEVPEMALTRLTDAVRLTGRYGVDYHACIGPRARFMHAVEPEWFEQNEQYLFGRAASAELGRVALDVCLIWYQPDAFILERYSEGVLDAIERGTPRALRHLLCGLLWGTPGYDPEHIAKELLNLGSECVSKAGGCDMFDLLREDAGAEHVRRAVDFWDCVLKQSPKPEALVGFGWYASIPGIDQRRWEELMMRTCEIAEKLDWSQRVAERIRSSQTITDTGWKILARLFGIDIGYEVEMVAKHAMEALCKTVGIADAPDSRSHLREVLVNHGFHDAAEF